MFKRIFFALTIVIAPANAWGQETPTGTLKQFVFQDSKIFPGTTRDVWIYVPAQYKGDKPACVATFCDGQSYVDPKQENYAPAVFDKLIANGEMPVTIGVFVNPGVVPSPRADALPRFNRSYEYDGLGEDYASFLETELFPFIAKEHELKLSKDPNDRLIGGASSGGNCAFNAAWSRPDLFRRVWCTVGTFVGLRGADELHTLVRKTEAKPIRIFMHDGSNDLNIYAGDWWMANQQMERALEWMGYEHEHVWDESGHGRDGEKKYLTVAMQYLWKDWPQSVTTHPEKAAKRRADFVLPDQPWELVSDGHKATGGIASNEKGEIFFSDSQNSTIDKIQLDGTKSIFANDTGSADSMMFAADGRLIVFAAGKQQFVAYSSDGNSNVLAEGVGANDLCVGVDGTIYFTSTDGNVCRIKPGSNAAEKLDAFPGSIGLVLCPDQTQLYVSESPGRMVTAYQVGLDGTLAHKQPYYWLHQPYRADKSVLGGMTVDRDGWLYVATMLGIQICDQAGRVNFIISPPSGAQHPSSVCFGGHDMDILFVTCGDKVFKRQLSKTGVHSWQPPLTPAKPQL